MPDTYLTTAELRALELLKELAGVMQAIIGTQGEQWLPDWSETVSDIHRLQQRVMAQAAARAYPDRFRQLGG